MISPNILYLIVFLVCIAIVARSIIDVSLFLIVPISFNYIQHLPINIGIPLLLTIGYIVLLMMYLKGSYDDRKIL